MYLTQPFTGGKAYEHADIAIIIFGQPFDMFTSIEYSDDQDIKNVFAAGSKVHSRTHGNEDPTAKISLLMAGLEALQSAVPTGRIQDIPEFDIVVTFIDTAFLTKVHKIHNCRFKNNGRKASTGDGAIIVDVDLVISHITWK